MIYLLVVVNVEYMEAALNVAYRALVLLLLVVFWWWSWRWWWWGCYCFCCCCRFGGAGGGAGVDLDVAVVVTAPFSVCALFSGRCQVENEHQVPQESLTFFVPSITTIAVDSV